MERDMSLELVFMAWVIVSALLVCWRHRGERYGD